MAALDQRIIHTARHVGGAAGWSELCYVATLGHAALPSARSAEACGHAAAWSSAQLRDSVQMLQAARPLPGGQPRPRTEAPGHSRLAHRHCQPRAVRGEAWKRLCRTGKAVCGVRVRLGPVQGDQRLDTGHGAGDALLRHVSGRLPPSLVKMTPWRVPAATNSCCCCARSAFQCRSRKLDWPAGWKPPWRKPYAVTGLELHVSPSIGIARSRRTAVSAEGFWHARDEASCITPSGTAATRSNSSTPASWDSLASAWISRANCAAPWERSNWPCTISQR